MQTQPRLLNCGWVVLKFAMFETGNRPQAVIMVPGILELDMSGKPGASDQADAQPALARAA